jgi:hypothetical protein
MVKLPTAQEVARARAVLDQMPEQALRARATLRRFRARYRYVDKTLPLVTYKKVEGGYKSHPSETTYAVLKAGRVLGYVGLKRRENWRKAGRLRTSLIGLTRLWWSGDRAVPLSRDHTFSETSYNRTSATRNLLEHLYDLSHPEVETPGF